ncbi:2-methylaconitate isomerase [Chromobacterium vaccinii]|nr:2-methylaconitate isomerase [Chromobacterium vaccinii]QND90778.1 2-methylaconitate isomerase [Chromobacterium vaccinii]
MDTDYRLPATLMRGGTSKGLFIRADALPDDTEQWQSLLLRAIGSPDPYGRQTDGLGNGTTRSSKVVIVSPSRRDDCDVDALFGHVFTDEARIDWSGNCGNLAAAVPLFAVMEKLARPEDGVATIAIWQANVGKRILAELEIFEGQAVWQGDFLIDGVAFPGAPIRLRYLDPAGDCSEMFPTGLLMDKLKLPDGSQVDATLIDAGNPTLFVRARDFGLKGRETAAEIDPGIMRRLEMARAAATVAIGLADDIFAAGREYPATPKISFLSQDGDPDCALHARALSMGKLHPAYPGTDAIALACACATEGTLPAELAGGPVRGMPLTFSHPSGRLTLEAVLGLDSLGWKVDEVVLTRTARPLMRGEVFIPLD